VDLKTFREIVDRTPTEIAAIRDQPEQLFAYAGLDFQGSYQLKTVGDALNDRIRAAFKTGHRTVFSHCRSLITDLIREHVLFDLPLDPYYDLLGRLRDAARRTDSGGDVDGDWEAAIKAARDSVEMSNYSTPHLRGAHAREYNVAEAAKALKQAGYSIRLEPGLIFVEEASQRLIVGEIERHIAAIGGINVARRLFKQITPIYDQAMGRYHIVPAISMSAGDSPRNPQIPVGYILQLAVKHLEAQEPEVTHSAHWQRLIGLATAYAAVIDVQPYYPAIWGAMDAKALLKYLQEQALYDSMFRFLQLRASDVVKICRGAFSFLDHDRVHPDGWTLSQSFEVIGYLINPRLDIRGPVIVDERDVGRGLSHLPRSAVTAILRTVLSHAAGSPNQHFSLPTDAPTHENKSRGADFYLKPLIRRPGNRYLIVDRSVCGWGYVEALLTALRPLDRDLDTKVGTAMEKVVEAEFVSHGVEVFSGDYDEGGHGECDIAVRTPEVLFFLELKKKTLTRRARAGGDADLLLDLAGSLLDAQAQAGWHELRITRAGFLDLIRDGEIRRLSLDGRGIEKIALGMLDFGSFQDRIVLKQFLEATLGVTFGSSNPAYDTKFKTINAALGEIREQYGAAHGSKAEVINPFFNCWFMSIPQLLIMLDEVSDAETFRTTVWSYRHMVTGTSDLYFEISNMRRMKAEVAAQTKA
jgi:hypothetical protein